MIERMHARSLHHVNPVHPVKKKYAPWNPLFDHRCVRSTADSDDGAEPLLNNFDRMNMINTMHARLLHHVNPVHPVKKERSHE